MSDAMQDMRELAERRKVLHLDVIPELNKSLEEAKAELARVDEKLVELMAANEMPRVQFGDRLFAYKIKNRFSDVAAERPKLFSWLRDKGHGDLIKESVHPATFNKFMDEFLDGDATALPEELKGVVSVYEQPTISMTKATVKTGSKRGKEDNDGSDFDSI